MHKEILFREGLEDSLPPEYRVWLDFGPDMSFLDTMPPRNEVSDEELLTYFEFDFGLRANGSSQVGVLFGGNHSQDSGNVLFDLMPRVWDHMKSIAGLKDLELGVEGRVRTPQASAADDEVFSELGELGFMEHIARRAGLPDGNIFSPEPNVEALAYLGHKYGWGATQLLS
jgi:hypothetical protein